MTFITLKKEDLGQAMAKAKKTYALAGPVRDGNEHLFRRLGPDEVPDLSYTCTRLSPKELIFPRTEPLFQYRVPARAGKEETTPSPSLEAPSFEEAPLALVGIRPYDARAFDLLRLNFDTGEYKDPYFVQRYETMTRVGLAETRPDPTNFSPACGTGPFDESCLDILLAEAGDAFIGKILTPKGEAFAEAAGFEKGGPEIEERIAALKQKTEAGFPPSPSFDRILIADALDLYNNTDWESLAFSCINCGTCTFSCPTCWCFDIQDEMSGEEGVRLRLWDSCMTELYSAHASGHNPRQKGFQRFRNRFMHKLKYFADKYGQGIMCVGCGRCISSCPANIDIRQIIQTLNREEAVPC
ncbi:4Fe-4S dicluster domain-containing protein [Desulfospira joergensenii]|uniref:4Fe-4S dicluster domain-containing protein n=1 Tax=Desulfospira joergensenii TaxID=53329 RepID=UPI0003B766A7|nr:4Fe-4S dicluster domain-containing protein [Desulfospira joergensenii]